MNFNRTTRISNMMAYINNIAVALVLVGTVYFGRQEYKTWFDSDSGVIPKMKIEIVEDRARLQEQLIAMADDYRKDVLKSIVNRDWFECQARLDYHCELVRRTASSERIPLESLGISAKDLNENIAASRRNDTVRLSNGETVVELR